MSPPSNNKLNASGIQSSGSPLRMNAVPFDKELWANHSLKTRLNQVDDYLDLNKLMKEIKNQGSDSYALRNLLAKVREHCTLLQQVEASLHAKSLQLRKAIQKSKCASCLRRDASPDGQRNEPSNDFAIQLQSASKSNRNNMDIAEEMKIIDNDQITEQSEIISA